MASPFPGMDPFVELRTWHDFHPQFIVGVRHYLVPHLRPKYVVETEERVYLERFTDEPEYIRPALTVIQDVPSSDYDRAAISNAVASMEPSLRTVPVPEDVKERYLVIKERKGEEIVTVIELLSPANKRRRSDGQKQYMKKRREVLRTETNLVEIDLLRGGERLPLRKPIVGVDYCAVVCRGNKRPQAELFAWMLRERMPTIPVPLAGDDPDVPLDLQGVFNSVYDQAGYDYSLPYRLALKPKLRDEDELWLQGLLASRKPA